MSGRMKMKFVVVVAISVQLDVSKERKSELRVASSIRKPRSRCVLP